MKKITTLLVGLAVGFNAVAGTDTLVQFANMAPYQASVSFADVGGTCWHDTNALADGRVAEYADYYTRGGVSSSDYTAYLTQYKNAFGGPDLAAVPTFDMNAATTLAAATTTAGLPVATAIFRGETSANLFEGCKDATSSRSFVVTLSDASGQALSRKVYTLTDPPGSQFTLSRMQDANPAAVDQTIVLGSGGKADPIAIGVTAVSIAMTAVTIGTAGPELYEARAALLTAAAWENAEVSGLQMTKALFKYALKYGLQKDTYVVGGQVFARALWTPINPLKGLAAHVVYEALIDRGLEYFASAADGTVTPLSGPAAAAATSGIDFSTPTLTVMDGLGDSPTVCAYQTTTFGIPECRLTGISLAIMPDGSLVFAPMPQVGSGD